MSATTVVDQDTARYAKRLAGELGEQLGALEGTLAACSGFFDEGLPSTVVGKMGISATEIRQQMPALREAAREVGRS